MYVANTETAPECLECLDTGTVMNWRHRTTVPCPDCKPERHDTAIRRLTDTRPGTELVRA